MIVKSKGIVAFFPFSGIKIPLIVCCKSGNIDSIRMVAIKTINNLKSYLLRKVRALDFFACIRAAKSIPYNITVSDISKWACSIFSALIDLPSK